MAPTATTLVHRPPLHSTLEPRGNVTGADPTQYTTSYTFDAYGKPLAVTDPLGHQSVYAYDKDENQTYFKDANGHATNYTYDDDSELTKIQRPDQSLVQTTYDANGNVASQVDGLSHSVTYAYDGLNRKTSMTDALNRATSYAYDLASNMTSLTDAKSKTTTYKYDAGDQLVGIQYSDGVTPNVSYAYDALGQRTSMTDGTGTTSYVYDSLRRLTSNTNGAGAQVGYGYDLKGQLTSLVYPGSLGTVTRTYDDAGQLKTVADWLSHTTTFSYDAASHLTGIAYPNTVAATYTFDNAGRVTAIADQQGTNPAFINLTYGRDFIGQLTGDSSATPSTFGYDSLNRQTSGSGNLNYTYDAADRITGINVTGGNQGTLAYDNGDQLTSYTIMNGATQVQKYTYAFDANGNRTSRTDASNNTVNYGWDQANRLISYGSSATYAYNGDGLRMSKTVSGSSEAFTWDAAEGLPLLLTDGSTAFVTGPGGLPLEQIAGGSALYFHQDQLGSTLALTDGAGAVQMTKAYDAYGNVVSSTGSASTPLQYAGQYVDTESGLYYLRARYYDPAVGEFVARDPVVSATRQAYLYVADSPLNGSDRSGLWAIGWDAGWSAGIALGNGAAIDSSFGEGIVSDNSDVVVSTAGSYAGGTCDYEPCGLSRPAQRHAGDNGGVDVHAGAGGGAWISNVSSYRDLAGDAERHTATALIVTVNLDTWSAHGQSFFACGISIGKGIGLGYQQYGVHTEITSRTPALSGEAP